MKVYFEKPAKRGGKPTMVLLAESDSERLALDVFASGVVWSKLEPRATYPTDRAGRNAVAFVPVPEETLPAS